MKTYKTSLFVGVINRLWKDRKEDMKRYNGYNYTLSIVRKEHYFYETYNMMFDPNDVIEEIIMNIKESENKQQIIDSYMEILSKINFKELQTAEKRYSKYKVGNSEWAKKSFEKAKKSCKDLREMIFDLIDDYDLKNNYPEDGFLSPKINVDITNNNINKVNTKHVKKNNISNQNANIKHVKKKITSNKNTKTTNVTKNVINNITTDTNKKENICIPKTDEENNISEPDNKAPIQTEAPEEQQDESSNDKHSEFSKRVMNKENTNNVVNKLKSLIEGKKGKDVALIIRAAINKGIITRPTFTEVTETFGNIGNKSGYNKYMKERSFTDSEIDPILNQL
jgi:hypothetical protein